MTAPSGRKTKDGQPLHLKMRALAAFGHARAAELLAATDAVESAKNHFVYIKAMARARRLWTECVAAEVT